MRIAHICPFVGERMGGSERYVWNLSRTQARNHEVHIYTTTQNPKRVGTRLSDGVTVHRHYSPLTLWNINPLVLMMKPLMMSESDIFHIHSHLYFTSNQAVAARVLKKKRSLLQLHGGVGIPPYDVGLLKLSAKHFYDRSVGKFTIMNSSLIASVSRSDLKQISKQYNIGEERFRYVPNMVDVDAFRPQISELPEARTLLFVGDLEAWKGVGSLIQWIHAMSKTRLDSLTFRFVGQGSYMKDLINLRERLHRLGSTLTVEILGPRNHSEIPSILQRSNALVLPSYWEGMPTVVIEAMASGIPVISTKVGDVPSVVGNRETGFLIDRSISSFEEAVSAVLTDSELVGDVTRNARKLVEREFSPLNVSRVVDRVYSEVIS